MRPLFLLLPFVLSACGPAVKSGLVFQKRYEPDQSYTSYEHSYDEKGNMTSVYPVYHHIPERHILVVRGETEKGPVIEEFEVSPVTYGQARSGLYYDHQTGALSSPVKELEK